MAVPKSKTSKSKRNMRRSHHAAANFNPAHDHMGNVTFSHNISPQGFYKGRKIFVKPTDETKKEEKA